MIHNRERNIIEGMMGLGMLFGSYFVYSGYDNYYDVVNSGVPIPEFDLSNPLQTPELYDDMVFGGLSFILASLIGGIVATVRREWKDSSQQNKKD